MAADSYIPVGRTSMARQGAKSLQVQTEYAPRPAPRITTTISHQGQVVHKIERTLERAIDSPEAQNRVERTLRNQHAEIIAIIEKPNCASIPTPAATESQSTATAPVPVASGNEGDPESTVEAIPGPVAYSRLQEIPGVKRIYRLDNEGNIVGRDEPTRFRQAFAAIFRNLEDLVSLFAADPGAGFTRQKGVLEVERDHLYFASAGYECYFLVVSRIDETTNYEDAIKAAISL